MMAKIDDLTVNLNISVSYDTAKTCLRLLELYLNNNDTELLIVENNEPGAWHLVIKNWRDFNDECE